MPALSDGLLADVCRSLAVGKIDAVTHIANRQSVADSTQKYVLTLGEIRHILIISSAAAPQLVQRAVKQQRLAKSLLQGKAAEAIELPLAEGFHGQLSYALWPMRQALSSNRLLLRIDKLRLGKRLYWWTWEVAVQTLGPADPATLAANARRLCGVSSLPLPIRRAAEDAAEAFAAQRVRAIQLLQHGDLWIGNVLKAVNPIGFVIIDWAGARLDGSPFFDLLKLALSLGNTPYRVARQMRAHSQVIGCDPSDARAYVIAGLGQLYESLEFFPEARFVELCQKKLELLDAALSINRSTVSNQ